VETIKSIGKGPFSSACRERAVKFYNKDDRFAEYVDLYKEKMGSISLTA
jgi:putative colanic acid biosynthesis glycosyltransferase